MYSPFKGFDPDAHTGPEPESMLASVYNNETVEEEYQRLKNALKPSEPPTIQAYGIDLRLCIDYDGKTLEAEGILIYDAKNNDRLKVGDYVVVGITRTWSPMQNGIICYDKFRIRYEHYKAEMLDYFATGDLYKVLETFYRLKDIADELYPGDDERWKLYRV